LRDIISRANGEPDVTTIKFGYGVVRGVNPSDEVVLPDDTMTDASTFVGVVLTGITEHGLDGEIRNIPTKMLNILNWGKTWVVVPDDLVINYGDPVYLIIGGPDLGKFTNDSASGGVLLRTGRFIGAVDSTNIAPVEFYNAPKV
jgi:hypothetical protein